MKHEILNSIPFFSVLEKEELATLALHMEFHMAPKHGLIYTEGEAVSYTHLTLPTSDLV